MTKNSNITSLMSMKWIWIFSFSFYSGFEKQRELSGLNTMQVRKEAVEIMKKLNGSGVWECGV